MKCAKRKELTLIDHENIDYQSFRKDFYRETQEIKNMTEEEVNFSFNIYNHPNLDG